jgi:hypothetical protein
MSLPIDPGLVVHTVRIGDQRISLPPTERVSHPQRSENVTLVCDDLAHVILTF